MRRQASRYEELYAEWPKLCRAKPRGGKLPYGSRLDKPWIPNPLVRFIRERTRPELRSLLAAAERQGRLAGLDLLTVVITSFNREKYIGPAIESVLNSTFADFALLVLDDSSTDGSAEVARSYAARDERIRLVVNERNLGQFGIGTAPSSSPRRLI